MADFMLTAGIQFEGVDKAVKEVKKKLSDIVKESTSKGGSLYNQTDAKSMINDFTKISNIVEKFNKVMDSATASVNKHIAALDSVSRRVEVMSAKSTSTIIRDEARKAKAYAATEAARIRAEGAATRATTNVISRISRRASEGMLSSSDNSRMISQAATALNTYTKALKQSAGDTVALAKANNVYRASLDEVRKELTDKAGLFKKLDQSAKKFGGTLGNITVMGQGFERFIYNTGVALTAISGAFGFRQIYDAIVAMDTFKNTLNAVSGDSNIAAYNIEFLKKTANTLGVSIEAVATPFAQFFAAARESGMSVNTIQESFNKLIASTKNFGLSAADTSGVVRALTQSLSKGTLQAEEIKNQLGDRMPVAMAALAQATGKSRAELDKMMKAGQLGTEEYLIPFIEAMLKTSGGMAAVEKSAQSMQSVVARLGNAFTIASSEVAGPNGFTEGVKAGANALTAFMESSQGDRFFKTIGEAVKMVSTAVVTLASNVDYLAGALAVLAASKVVVMLVSFVSVLSSMNPIMLVIKASIAALTVGLADLFGKWSQEKTAKEDQIKVTAALESAQNTLASTYIYSDQYLKNLNESQRTAIALSQQKAEAALLASEAIQKTTIATVEAEIAQRQLNDLAMTGFESPIPESYANYLQEARDKLLKIQQDLEKVRTEMTRLKAASEEAAQGINEAAHAMTNFSKTTASSSSEIEAKIQRNNEIAKAYKERGKAAGDALTIESKAIENAKKFMKKHNSKLTGLEYEIELNKAVEQQRRLLASEENKSTASSSSKKALKAGESELKRIKKITDVLQAQIDGYNDLAEAELKGAAAVHEANLAKEIAVKLSEQRVSATSEEGKAIADLMRKEDEAKRNRDYNKTIRASQEQLDIERQILGVSNLTGNEREKAVRHIELVTQAEKELLGASKEKKDEWIKLNEEIDDTKRKSKQVQDAWDSVANSLEKAFDQVGEAIVEAIVQGKDGAIDFKKIMKGLAASILSDFAKLAIANPLKNMMFGSNNPTIFNVLGGGNTSGVINQLSGVTSTGSSGGLLDSLGLGKLFGGGTGGGLWDAIGLPNGLNTSLFSYGAPATGVTAVGGNSAGVMGLPTGGSPSNFTLGNALSGVGAAFNAFNAFKAFQSGNVIGGIGNTVGAGAGIASMLGIGGSLMGPLAIAAPLIGSLFGKAKVKHPAASVHIESSGGKMQTGQAFSKHMGTSDIIAAGDAIANTINSVFTNMFGETAKFLDQPKALSIAFDQKANKYTAHTPYGQIDFDNAEDAMKELTFAAIKYIPKTGIGEDIATAIANSVATNIEDLSKDIEFGKNFQDTISSLKSNIGLEDTVRKQANESIKATIQQFQDFKKKTEELYPSVSVTTGQITSMKTVMEEMDASAAIANGTVIVSRFSDEMGNAYNTYRDLSGNVLELNSNGKLLIPTLKEITEVVGSTETTLSKQAKQAQEALRAYVDNMISANDPKVYTETEAAVVSLKETWKSMGPLLEEVGYSADQVSLKIDEGLNNNLKKLSDNYITNLDATINEVSGKSFLNEIESIKKGIENVKKDLTSLGLPLDKADELYQLQIKNILKTLDSSQLKEVVDKFGNQFDAIIQTLEVATTVMEDLEARRLSSLAQLNPMHKQEAEDYARKISQTRELASATTAEQVEMLKKIHAIENTIVTLEREKEVTDKANQALEARSSLEQRALTLKGKTTEASLLQFDTEAAKQIQLALSQGLNITDLSNVISGERTQLVFESYKQELLDSYDRQIRTIEDNTTALNESSSKLIELRSTLNKAAKAAIISEASPLGLEDKLIEARKQFEDLVNAFNDASLTEDARYRAGEQIQSAGESLISLASSFYGGTNRSDFDNVLSTWTTLGTTSQDQLDETQKLIDVNNKQIEELRKQRDAIERMGERQVDSIENLTAKTQEAYTKMIEAIGKVTTSTPTQYSWPSQSKIEMAAQQTANIGEGLKTGIARSQGYSGETSGGAYWNWLTEDVSGSRMSAWIDRTAIVNDVRNTEQLLASKIGNYQSLKEQFARSQGYSGEVSGGKYADWLSQDSSFNKWREYNNFQHKTLGYATGGEFVMPAPKAAEYANELIQMRSGSYSNDNTDELCAEIKVLRETNSALMKQLINITVASGQANIDGLQEVVNVQKSQKDMARAA